MDQRQRIICDTFADWSDDCQTEYKARFIEAPEVVLSETLSQKAMAAYEDYKQTDFWVDAKAHDQAREDFWDAAIDYFSMRVPDGAEIVSIRLYDKEQHVEKWQSIFNSIDECETLIELGRFLRSEPQVFRLLETILEVRATSLENLKKKIVKRLEQERAAEFQSDFGYDSAYRAFGLDAALAHFDAKITKPRGRKKRKFGNPDAYRARTYWKILETTNQALDGENLKLSSWKEICEVTFGIGSDLMSYPRAPAIRWAYDNYFNASNVTVEGFLNSLSRGRSVLAQYGWPLK